MKPVFQFKKITINTCQSSFTNAAVSETAFSFYESSSWERLHIGIIVISTLSNDWPTLHAKTIFCFRNLWLHTRYTSVGPCRFFSCQILLELWIGCVSLQWHSSRWRRRRISRGKSVGTEQTATSMDTKSIHSNQGWRRRSFIKECERISEGDSLFVSCSKWTTLKKMEQ